MTVVDGAMRAYYDRRAREYDDWWLGSGLFAARERPGWDAEVAQLIELLHSLTPARVLDVACGTGFLTRHLRGEVTALDQSPAMVAVVAQRIPAAHVVRGEAVPLPFADGAFERLVTGHFYGHLLAGERERFVGEACRVAGELIVVDSALRDGVAAEQWQQRVLEDGSTHEVYKRYFTAGELAAELGGGETLHDGNWFVVVRSTGRNSSLA
jgi:demethylmenaquinone methyltransferase/2-methoxy-6-polyprenyl-1,4-benzoquinol methylase